MRNLMHGKKIAVMALCAGSPAMAQQFSLGAGFGAALGSPGVQNVRQNCELGTSLAGFKNTPDGGTAFFDLIIASWPIEIGSLGLNVTTSSGTPFHIDIYTSPATFQGKELDPTQWTLRAGGDGQSSGMGNLSFALLASRIALDANSSQGMAIVITGAGHRYENGNGTNEFFENDDLSIKMGSITFAAFGPSAFRPRVWNGMLWYYSPFCSCPCACEFATSGPGICDLIDFTTFAGLFAQGDPCACDIDTSTGVGVCDLVDFVTFAAEFAGGCP